MHRLIDMPIDLVKTIQYRTSIADFGMASSRVFGSSKAEMMLASNVQYALSMGHCGIRLPRHNSVYTGTGISIRCLKRLLDKLESEDYIRNYVGGFLHEGDERVDLSSCVLFTEAMKERFKPKAPELYKDVVHIRDRETKKRLANRGRSGIKAMSDVVVDLNRLMLSCSITQDDQTIPIQQFRRIFSGSLDSGGRFYSLDGGIQTMPSNERRQLLMSGSPVAELDYSCMHPSIIHELKNRENDVEFIDPYDFSVSQIEFSCAPKEVVRDYFKMALIIALNCKDFKSAEGALRHKFESDSKFHVLGHHFASDVLKEAYSHNLHLREYFFCDMGLFLQNIDSQIMSSLINMTNANMMPVIPVHDSVIIQEHNVKEVSEMMIDAYTRILGGSKFCVIEQK